MINTFVFVNKQTPESGLRQVGVEKRL